MQVKGRNLNNPPPRALSLPLKRNLSPSDICPKQFWDFSRKFLENFGTFRTFSLLRPPTNHRVSRPSEVFSLLFRTFFVIFRTFFRTFQTFSVTFRAFFVTPSAPSPLHVWTIVFQFLELSMLQSHNLSSLSSEPSINVLWDHPKASDCSMASQMPIIQKIQSRTHSTLTLNKHTTKILKTVWIEP